MVGSTELIASTLKYGVLSNSIPSRVLLKNRWWFLMACKWTFYFKSIFSDITRSYFVRVFLYIGFVKVLLQWKMLVNHIICDLKLYWKSHMKILGTLLRAWRYVRENVWLLNIILRLYNNRSFAPALILMELFVLFYCCIKLMCKKFCNVRDPLIHQYLLACHWTSLSVRDFQSPKDFMPINQTKLEKTRTGDVVKEHGEQSCALVLQWYLLQSEPLGPHWLPTEILCKITWLYFFFNT